MEAQTIKRTGLPTAAGVMEIIAGVLALLGTLGCIIALVVR